MHLLEMYPTPKGDLPGQGWQHGEDLQYSLLHDRSTQAVLDGERGNVLIVGGNEALLAVIILLQRSFAR